MKKIPRVLLSAAALAVVFGSVQPLVAQTPAPAQPALTQTILVENEQVKIRRIILPVGLNQQMHFGGNGWDEITVQLSEGQMRLQINDQVNMGKPGQVYFMPRMPAKHAFANLGKAPVEILVFSLKKP